MLYKLFSITMTNSTLNCHHYLSTSLLFCKRFNIIYQMSYITCFSRIVPSPLPQSTFNYHIGVMDDEVWCHLSLMPLIIDDYATTCRCCGRKGVRWCNGRYIHSRSITSAETLLNRNSVENRSRDYIVGRIGHYLMALEVLCNAAEICLYGCMSHLGSPQPTYH